MPESMLSALTEANARLQLLNEQLRESNAWYRERNAELLRLLSGRASRPEPVPVHARSTLDLGETEQPPPVAGYIRAERAHL